MEQAYPQYGTEENNPGCGGYTYTDVKQETVEVYRVS
jgi:hypothetical protein